MGKAKNNQEAKEKQNKSITNHLAMLSITKEKGVQVNYCEIKGHFTSYHQPQRFKTHSMSHSATFKSKTQHKL